MNAANEVAVSKFLGKRIRFSSIAYITKKVMNNGRLFSNDKVTLENILHADQWARRESEKVIERMH